MSTSVPLRYDPLYWGAVFPLGMYTACTFQMAKAMHLDFLLFLPRLLIYVALAAWIAAFVGLCRRTIAATFGLIRAGRIVRS